MPVRVTLTPGDATVYHLLIVPPHASAQISVDPAQYPFCRSDEYLVCLLNLDGRSHVWEPDPDNPVGIGGYWSDHPHTSSIVGAFLHLLTGFVNP